MSALHLEGLEVIDLTRLLPGPMCTMMLADMGADVIKVEDTRGGDYARYFPPIVGDSGAFFSAVNRNKRSITLDLKADRGPEILRRLVAEADVLVESFRPGVMDRLGVGWESLREVNPRLVYCAISGFGQTGPDSDRAGHDLGYMARTGLLDLLGRRGGPVVVPSFQLADIAGGALFATVGILSALLGRHATGEGSFVDISMTEGALAFAIPSLANHCAGDEQRRGDNMLTGKYPCYDVYETSDGRYLAVAPLEPKFWLGFVSAIGRADLADEGLDDGGATRDEVAEVIATRTLDEWAGILRNVDVCCEPIMTFDEVLNDPQHTARDLFFDLDGVRHVRTPVTPTSRTHTPSPSRGEHTEAVLRELGYGDDDLEALRQEGVTGS